MQPEPDVPLSRDKLLSMQMDCLQRYNHLVLLARLSDQIIKDGRPLPKEKIARLRNIILSAAVNDHESVQGFLEQNEGSLDQALFGAALGGHTQLVKYLLERGASHGLAMMLALFAGQKQLILELLKDDNIDVDEAMKIMVAIADRIPNVVNEILQERKDLTPNVVIAAHIYFQLFNASETAAQFLTLFTSHRMRGYLARMGDYTLAEELVTVSLAPLLPITLLMKRYQVNYEQACFWHQHREILPSLLLQEQGAYQLPMDLWETIACHLSEGTPFPLTEMHSLKQAISRAYEPAWFRCLERTLRTYRNGTEKADHLHTAATMPERIHVLAEHRYKTQAKKSFLPSSLKRTMIRYPEYCNGLTLYYWLNNCADYLEHRISRQKRLAGQQLRELIQVIELVELSCDPVPLADVLENNHGQAHSIRDLLEPMPFWQDLLALFPEVAKVLTPVENYYMVAWSC